MEIGGGFGGKLHTYIEPVAALLSKKTGRPVKVTLTRTEEFEGTGPTCGGYVKAKVGATKDGRIIAAEVHSDLRGWRFSRRSGEPGNAGRFRLL